jgi:predicted GNAT superfamily acetyltransferase
MENTRRARAVTSSAAPQYLADGARDRASVDGEDREAWRKAARKRLRALMRKGLDIGYKGPLDRDRLHERGE